MKKIVAILVSLVLVVSATAALAAEKVYIAGTSGATDTQSIAHQELADRLNATGNWDAEAKIGGAMGETDDVTEQAIQGMPVLNASDPGRMAAYVPDYGLIQMPYIFPDYTYLDKVMDTELYATWEKAFEEKGIKLVTSNCFSGIRSVILKDDKIVHQPSDLKGYKLRTIGNDLFCGTVELMGAIPTAMAWGETYQGIEQGAVDGTEAQIPGIYSMRFYEVCKSLSLTEHFYLIGSIVTGTSWFNTLDEAHQTELMTLARQTYHDNQELVNELSAKYLEEMQAAGLHVETIDKTPFIEAVQPLYEKLGYTDLKNELYKELGL